MISQDILKEKLEQVTHLFDFCSFQLELSGNLLLHYVEGMQGGWMDIKDFNIEQYTLSFKFYDCHYYLYVPDRCIIEDSSFGMTQEGESKLFDSFESLMEGDCWEHIKLICAKYKELALKNEKE